MTDNFNTYKQFISEKWDNRTNLGVMTMGGSASYWTDEMIEGIADVEPQYKMVNLNKVELNLEK